MSYKKAYPKKDPWKVLLCEEENVILGYISKDRDVIIKVAVDEALEFTVEYLSLELPVNHPIYKEHKRSVAKIPIQWLLESVSALNKCNGITHLKLIENGEQYIRDRKHICVITAHIKEKKMAKFQQLSGQIPVLL